MNTIMGVDPGRRGAVAVVSPRGWMGHQDGAIIELVRMPIVQWAEHGIVDWRVLSELAFQHGCTHMIVERQWAQGWGKERNTPRGAHTAGRLFGSLLTIASVLQIETVMVTPVAWKKATGLINLPKEAAVDRARLLFPTSWDQALGASTIRNKHIRIAAAEAALIAYYGRSICSQPSSDGDATHSSLASSS